MASIRDDIVLLARRVLLALPEHPAASPLSQMDIVLKRIDAQQPTPDEVHAHIRHTSGALLRAHRARLGVLDTWGLSNPYYRRAPTLAEPDAALAARCLFVVLIDYANPASSVQLKARGTLDQGLRLLSDTADGDVAQTR